MDFYPEAGSNEPEMSWLSDHIWRVAGREDGWFTVELAAFADGRSLRDQLTAREVPVTPDGREEPVEPDCWKQHAELYLVEAVPFGTVTVLVPRNVREPEAYALGRARTLIGVGEPEYVVVRDFLRTYRQRPNECPEGLRPDVFVELHFNGHHER